MFSQSTNRLQAAKAAVVASLFTCLSLIAPPAHAVFLEADAIEANGSFGTVDLWFFSFAGAAATTLQINDLGGPPVAGADPDIIVYLDDGAFSTVFAADTAAGADPAIAALFPAGAYVAVVANHPLAVGQFGPTLSDVSLAVGGYLYEFNGPEPVGASISINCILSGNLAGGYTKRVLAQDTCRPPPISSPVPEPISGAMFGPGPRGHRRKNSPPASAVQLSRSSAEQSQRTSASVKKSVDHRSHE